MATAMEISTHPKISKKGKFHEIFLILQQIMGIKVTNYDKRIRKMEMIFFRPCFWIGWLEWIYIVHVIIRCLIWVWIAAVCRLVVREREEWGMLRETKRSIPPEAQPIEVLSALKQIYQRNLTLSFEFYSVSWKARHDG